MSEVLKLSPGEFFAIKPNHPSLRKKFGYIAQTSEVTWGLPLVAFSIGRTFKSPRLAHLYASEYEGSAISGGRVTIENGLVKISTSIWGIGIDAFELHYEQLDPGDQAIANLWFVASHGNYFQPGVPRRLD